MPAEFSNVFFKQPAFALVIGISNYKNGVDTDEGDQLLEPKQFPNLKLAAKDAQDFATFLRTNGFIGENVRLLLNQEAGIDEIRGEFDALRRQCKSSEDADPLVFVYFSGHGWPDEDEEEDRHYLVPWDAERDKLPTTALSNQTVSEMLSSLKTNRLAVFIDACHAGAIAMPGPRGAQLQYDHKALGEGQGRYLIASCKRGQKSYELKPEGNPADPKDNGIFTGHLLQLLKCETDDLDIEEIDILKLYYVLKDKVRRTAREQYEKDQDPQLDTREGAGLILAINQRVKNRRLEADKEAQEQKRKFMSLICDQIKAVGPEDKFSIMRTLREYVEKATRELENEEFFGIFEEQFRKWVKSRDESKVQVCSKFLILAYQDASNSAPVPKESPSQETKPVDKFEQPAGSKILGGDKLPTATSPPTLGDQQPARWQLSTEDRDHILEKIKPHGAYYKATGTLLKMLNKPVSEAEFVSKVVELGGYLQEEDDLQLILDEILVRFQECWAKSKTNAPEKLSDFLMKRR